MGVRRLLGAADTGIATVLIQGTSDPVFGDTWTDGEDLVCGHCEASVLAHDIADDQLLDIGLQCYACGGISQSRLLPSGMALPGRYVVAPVGRYMIKGTVDLRRVVFVGENGSARRSTEAGLRGTTFGPRRSSARDLKADGLNASLNELRSILGTEVDRLLISDAAGHASATPPISRHPLAELIAGVKESVAQLATAQPTVDLRPMTELESLLSLLRRWRQHPLWQKVVAALCNEYSHSHLVLATASFLEDVGNGVVFHESPSGRAADLQLVVGARESAMIEVKAPKVLRSRTTPLNGDEAYSIVEKAMKKAGTGATGQLSQKNAGLIVIGAFHISNADLTVLEQAAGRYLRDSAKRKRHKHLAGIAIAGIGTEVDASFDAVGKPRQTLSGVLNVRVAKNPGYGGSISLNTDPRTIY